MLVSEVYSITYEYLNSAKIYSKMIDFGAMPNNVNYYWIDLANSFFNSGACYPLTYVDCSNISNSIAVSVIEKGTKLKIVTKSNWSTYSAFITIKYSTK